MQYVPTFVFPIDCQDVLHYDFDTFFLASNKFADAFQQLRLVLQRYFGYGI